MKVTPATGFTLDGRFHPLPPYQARVLDKLVRAAGETVPDETLRSNGIKPRSMRVVVSRLRAHLPPGWVIRCELGVGYALDRPHTEKTSSIASAQHCCDRRIAGTK